MGRGQFVAINLSPVTLMSEDCHDLMAGAPAERIVLEITEHQPIEDYRALLATIHQLRDRGARLAVDDAGAGFASLRHILKLSPDFIKLDIGLTRDIDTDPVKRALVSGPRRLRGRDRRAHHRRGHRDRRRARDAAPTRRRPRPGVPPRRDPCRSPCLPSRSLTRMDST